MTRARLGETGADGASDFRTTSSPLDGIRTLEEARTCMRDMIAVSTLPAIWSGAQPGRIAESLLAVIETTIRPAMSYIRIDAVGGSHEPFVEHALVAGQLASQHDAAAVGRQVTSWASEHDPDEMLFLTPSPAGVPLQVCAYPLGFGSSMGVLAAGFVPDNGTARPTPMERTLLNMAANQANIACRNTALQWQAEAARAELQGLYDLSRSLGGELDPQRIVQAATDAATRLTYASFGAFFHNLTDEAGESYTLYTLSGAPRAAFEKFGMPRNTPLFDHTFRGLGTVRLHDVLQDSRYGTKAPHFGMPAGHLPVRSYLAVPVHSRSGEVIGGLFMGHPDPGVFTDRAERVATAVAAQAAVALDNAELFREAEREIASRQRAEDALRDSESRLQAAREAARLGIHDYDVPSGAIQWDARIRELWGVEADTPVTYDTWLAGVHADDRAAATEDIEQAMAPSADGSYRSEYRVVNRRDGKVRWIEATGHLTFRDGRAVRLVGTVNDITEQKHVQEVLRDASRRKDEFLATLAHELRNPLQPIGMAVEILGFSREDPERFEQMTAIIARQRAQLARLIDDLLDLGRINSGRVELRKQRVELTPIVTSAIEGVWPLCEERALVIRSVTPTDPILLFADPVRVAQIVGNLLNNACRYSERGGEILVTADVERGQAVVRVRDDGIGIEPDALGRIFEMFTRVERAKRHAPGGLGIGLALAHSLAQLHGGTLEARSGGPGTGSEFILTLPLPSGHARGTGRQPTLPAPDEPDEPVPVRPRRILAVDDHEDSLASVATLLRLRGHEVRTAASGEDALACLEGYQPEIVLLDIGLPGMDGYEVARRIRALPWGRDPLLIAMTGWGQAADKLKAANAGFDQHLTKPADPHVLERLIAAES